MRASSQQKLNIHYKLQNISYKASLFANFRIGTAELFAMPQ